MPLSSNVGKAQAILGGFFRHPIRGLRHQLRLSEVVRASNFCEEWANGTAEQRPGGFVPADGARDPENPLLAYFESHREGRGVFKWRHYFDIYHRHLQKFINSDVHLAEIGVLSGGSLEMWRAYLGPKCHVTGIDIHEGCRALEGPGTSIHIGDQADRSFWKSFRERSRPVDILIDDGGHTPEQQIVTLEEVLPFLRPGGVFVCEDVHGVRNPFISYVNVLADGLNAYAGDPDPAIEKAGELRTKATPLQQSIESVHFYPYVVVIEKSRAPVSKFHCQRRGTEWAGSSSFVRPA
jgi:hypothetical protein